MPSYKGHLVGGFIAFIIVINCIIVKKVSLVIALEWLCFTLLGALFPDIDTKSKGQKIFYQVLFVTFCVLLLKQCMSAFILMSLISCLPLIVHHRGVCHQLWFVGGVPCVAAVSLGFYFPQFATLLLWDALFFIIGAVSHIYLDVGFKRMLKIR